MASLNPAGAPHTVPDGIFFLLLKRATFLPFIEKLLENPALTLYFSCDFAARKGSRVEKHFVRFGRVGGIAHADGGGSQTPT
jgi:hypothetical protein